MLSNELGVESPVIRLPLNSASLEHFNVLRELVWKRWDVDRIECGRQRIRVMFQLRGKEVGILKLGWCGLVFMIIASSFV